MVVVEVEGGPGGLLADDAGKDLWVLFMGGGGVVIAGGVQMDEGLFDGWFNNEGAVY